VGTPARQRGVRSGAQTSQTRTGEPPVRSRIVRASDEDGRPAGGLSAQDGRKENTGREPVAGREGCVRSELGSGRRCEGGSGARGELASWVGGETVRSPGPPSLVMCVPGGRGARGGRGVPRRCAQPWRQWPGTRAEAEIQATRARKRHEPCGD